MATTHRLRYDALTPTTIAATIDDNDTTITFPSALQEWGSNIATIGTDQYIPLVLYSDDTDREIIYLTAYTAGATTGTILRAQEGSTGVAHTNGDSCLHVPTAVDFGRHAFARATRTAGNLTLNNTSWTDVDGSNLDVTVLAAAGDIVEYGIVGEWSGGQAVQGRLDAVTMVAGSPVNSVSSGGAAPTTGEFGVGAWGGPPSVARGLSGSVPYTVQAGDISGGCVTFRLRFRTDTAANKVLQGAAAASGYPLIVYVKNISR